MVRIMAHCRRSLLPALAAVLLTATPAVAAAPAGTRVELKVLVVTDGGPSAAAIADELRSQGVPYREVDLRDANRPKINAQFLADTVTDGGVQVDRGHYQAVVLPAANPFGNADELAALMAYQRRFDVPQVNAYVWPDATVGLQAPTYSGSLDGITATLTPAGRTTFGYLKGSVPFEDASAAFIDTYGFLARPLPADPATGAVATPLLTTTAPDGSAGNTLIAEYRADNRRQLSLTFSTNDTQQHFRLLAPGIVNWMTGGVHLGLHRNFLSVHVDDIFLPDSRWSTTGNCTPGADCPAGITTPDIRMNMADLGAAAYWQSRQKLKLDLAYNAIGAVKAAAASPTGRDPLTDSLVYLRTEFRWINHTYSHLNLGCIQDFTVIPWRCQTDASGATQWRSRAAITSEIADNLTWGNTHGLPTDRSELVTGEHSGLLLQPQQPQTNPNLGPALETTGVRWVAADNSRMPTQITVGPALTVPRHPMNLYYNVATRAELVDEYNWIYTARSDGGSGACESSPGSCIKPLDPATGFQNRILPQETRGVLSRVLHNDPRPHYVHQANLAGDRLLLALMDGIVDRYRSLLSDNAPIVNPRMAEAGAELRRQADWRAAVAAGRVSGYVQGKRLHIDAPNGLAVPITAVTGTRRGTADFGDAYAGLRSSWALPTTSTVELVLP